MTGLYQASIIASLQRFHRSRGFSLRGSAFHHPGRLTLTDWAGERKSCPYQTVFFTSETPTPERHVRSLYLKSWDNTSIKGTTKTGYDIRSQSQKNLIWLTIKKNNEDSTKQKIKANFPLTYQTEKWSCNLIYKKFMIHSHKVSGAGAGVILLKYWKLIIIKKTVLKYSPQETMALYLTANRIFDKLCKITCCIFKVVLFGNIEVSSDYRPPEELDLYLPPSSGLWKVKRVWSLVITTHFNSVTQLKVG